MTWDAILADTDAPAVHRRAIAELFIRDRIDPLKFAQNYAYILRGGMMSIRPFYGGDELGDSPTPAAKEIVSPLERPPADPNWYLAAYPDVSLWLQGVFRRIMDNENDPIGARLHGVMAEVLGEEFSAEEMQDEEGFMNFEYLNAVVRAHREVSGDCLECSVQGS